MSFSVSTRKQAKTAVLNVLDPVDRQETGWLVTFSGPGHEQTVKQRRDNIAKVLRDSRAGGRPQDRTVEQFEEDGVTTLVSRILSWEGLIDATGAAVPYTPEAASTILADPDYSWVANAFSRFLNDDASFMPGSATIS